MKHQTIKEECPKSYKALLAFCKKYLKVLEQAIGEGEPADTPEEELNDEMFEQAVFFMIQAQQRALYDFFDENKVFPTVLYRRTGFIYDVITDDEPSIHSGGKYENRPLAEDAMFTQAFKILEGKL